MLYIHYNTTTTTNDDNNIVIIATLVQCELETNLNFYCTMRSSRHFDFENQKRMLLFFKSFSLDHLTPASSLSAQTPKC